MTYVTWQRQDDVTYAKMCLPSLVTDTMSRFLQLESSKKLQGKNARGGWYPPPPPGRSRVKITLNTFTYVYFCGVSSIHPNRHSCITHQTIPFGIYSYDSRSRSADMVVEMDAYAAAGALSRTGRSGRWLFRRHCGGHVRPGPSQGCWPIILLTILWTTQGNQLEKRLERTGAIYNIALKQQSNLNETSAPELPNDDIIYRELRCLHFFHLSCVDHWLEEQIRCPECRSNIGILENEDSMVNTCIVRLSRSCCMPVAYMLHASPVAYMLHACRVHVARLACRVHVARLACRVHVAHLACRVHVARLSRTCCTPRLSRTCCTPRLSRTCCTPVAYMLHASPVTYMLHASPVAYMLHACRVHVARLACHVHVACLACRVHVARLSRTCCTPRLSRTCCTPRLSRTCCTPVAYMLHACRVHVARLACRVHVARLACRVHVARLACRVHGARLSRTWCTFVAYSLCA